MGFHGFSWEMVWLRFPAICFIDGGMQPLLQAMILKACKSVSKSVLLLVNQDLALKTSSFFHWYSCWKFSSGYFNLSSLYDGVMTTFAVISAACIMLGFPWTSPLAPSRDSSARSSMHESPFPQGWINGELFPKKHWRHAFRWCHHPEKTWLMNMF